MQLWYVCAQLLGCVQLFGTPMEHSPSGSSVHGILQARMLEWVAMPFSRGSSRLREPEFLASLALAGGFFTTSTICGALNRGKERTAPLWPLAPTVNIYSTYQQEERGRQRMSGWMALLTQWTWVWVNSRSWWWTGRPGVLWSTGLQRAGHDWVTELNNISNMPRTVTKVGDTYISKSLSLSWQLSNLVGKKKKTGGHHSCFDMIPIDSLFGLDSYYLAGSGLRDHIVLCLVAQSCLTLCNPMSCQAPLSMGFPRQEHWSGLPCPPPGDLPNPITPRSPVSPTLQKILYCLSQQGSPGTILTMIKYSQM